MKKFWPRLMLGVLLLSSITRTVMAEHPAYVAGTFYPGNREDLRSQVESFLKSPENPSSDLEPRILIVPHAGYVYSGKVAGRAFSEIKGKNYPLVILLGVAHRAPVQAAVLDSKGPFNTPLGKVEVDSETAAWLLQASDKITENSIAFSGEHSIETELPFLQLTLSRFKIVPFLMAEPDLNVAQSVGDAIARLVELRKKEGKPTLIVVSTDFAHYPSANDAQSSDAIMMERILNIDPEGLFKSSEVQLAKGVPHLATTMCGEQSTLTALFAARKLNISKPEKLMQANSSESPYGNPNETVGYGSLIFYDQKVSLTASKPADTIAAYRLSQEQKQRLLGAARSAIQKFLESRKKPFEDTDSDPMMMENKAVFVTLKEHGMLRGCIGSLSAKAPLLHTVQQYAILSATQDTRFHPVTLTELPTIEIEISILSEPRPVKDANEILDGIDGVILKRGDHTGVFLPQVWLESGWDKKRFLDELASQKAGLPPDAWRYPDTELSVFQDYVFKESDVR